MRLLKDILYKAGASGIRGTTNLAIISIASDSRRVQKGSLFIAVKGLSSDGHNYISEVISKGALAIVCEQLPDEIEEKVTYIQVGNSKQALGIIAGNFYDNPSEKLKLIGVTGTNGKTTIATLLHQLFSGLGYACGLISTVRNIIHQEISPSTHTTPDPIQLHSLLDKMVKAGCEFAFMEVSSHAVDQERIAGLTFAAGIFTNITHDHLDYHKTFENYLGAKKKFFDRLGRDAFALINKDTDHSDEMIEDTRARVMTYGLSSSCDFHCKVLEKHLGGMHLRIQETEVWVQLIGVFNAYNLLAVYGAAVELGQDKFQVLTLLSQLRSVEGRFEFTKSSEGVTAVVDYAHTPDALKNILLTLQDIRGGHEMLCTVVGCGGDRDAAKRPEMARIAADLSDRVILTSDNPRSEDPEEIIQQMKAGLDPIQMKKVLVIQDRREAIKTAIALSKKDDILLVAGKGHEKYQEIKGVRHPFDDLEEIKEVFNQTRH